MNFFAPLTNLFLTFVVFVCFATTQVNMRFRAKNTRDIACGRTDVWMYRRTDGGHVTITTSLPKFLGFIGYQISLAMELR